MMSSTPITANVNVATSGEVQRAATVTAVGFLILRLAVGIVFAMHGWQKLAVMGVGGVGGFFGSLGIPAPELMAIVVTAVELVGGIALIVGVGTRIAGTLLALDMLGALLLVHLANGFFMDTGGFEFVLTLAAAAVFFALVGPGAWAVDTWWSKRQ
jgi:putative oxidoreductase